VSAPGGLFLVFEGGDGVGKTTQVDRLCSWLADTGREVVRTLEPGGTPLGARIRRIVLDPATGDLSARAEALLYAADKAQHLHELVRPALARGAVVVCDRYVDSMLAYQGAGRVLAVDELEAVARWATSDLRPQLTVVLDVHSDRAVQEKTDKDRLEAAGEPFHERARHLFLELAARAPQDYLVLDARASRDDIAHRVQDRVRPLLTPSPRAAPAASREDSSEAGLSERSGTLGP
jgi:dTMP kinase